VLACESYRLNGYFEEYKGAAFRVLNRQTRTSWLCEVSAHLSAFISELMILRVIYSIGLACMHENEW